MEKLDLTRPIPPALTRGLEFAARRLLATDATGSQWRELLTRLSKHDAHGTWRRQAILALTRAEDAYTVLERLKDALLADDGRLLAELIRVVMSVEATPLAELLKGAGGSIEIPAGAEAFMMPRGYSWTWVVLWIVMHAQELPPHIIPDIARFLQAWLLATQAQKGELHRRAVEIIFEWLKRADEVLKPRSYRSLSEVPHPDFTFPNVREVRDDLRATFANFCDLTPELAKRYLEEFDVEVLRHTELESMLRHPAALVRAAPDSFATFALAALAEDDEEYGYRSSRLADTLGPFAHHSFQFMPASPGQGPFLELLLASPNDGLRLVHGIVDQSARWWRQRHENDGLPLASLSIPFPDGVRTFEGGASAYAWSRSERASSITTSALMALEAWGHQEIESGRSISDVMGDVLGEEGSSVALLAVAVDLALSHWPAAYAWAWPLLASPELLRYDDWRFTADVGGVNTFQPFLQQEAAHWKVKRADLEARPSRQRRLWDRIGEFVLRPDDPLLASLQTALSTARDRIMAMPHEDEDPVDGLKACARRAWRMSDPQNWRPVTVTRDDGSTAEMFQFIMEEDESRHRQDRQQQALAGMQTLTMRIENQKELLEREHSALDVVSKVIAWAKEKQAAAPADDEFEREWDHRAVNMAAALAVRDYVGEDHSEVLDWALPLLIEAASQEAEGYSPNAQIQYSAQAIAALGLMLHYERSSDAATRERLFALTASRHPAVIAAIGSRFHALSLYKPEFLRSLLRTGLANAIYVWEPDDELKKQKSAELQSNIDLAVAAEKTWLDQGGQEPAWPGLPEWHTRKRRGIRIPPITTEIEEEPDPPSFIAQEHALGSWIGQAIPLTISGVPPWLIDLSTNLLQWTTRANASPDGDDDDPDHRPTSWNHNFFDFLGVLSVAVPANEVIAHFVEPLCGYGEAAFCDCAGAFLRGFDRAMAATDTLTSDDPSAIRSRIAQHMSSMRGFSHLAKQKKVTAEWHLADLISAMYFHTAPLAVQHSPSIPLTLSDHPKLMQSLADLVIAAPNSGYLSTAFLNMLEQQADSALVPYLIQALSAWRQAYGVESTFWVHREIGTRACAWLIKVIESPSYSATTNESTELLSSLDTMIQSGVGLARQLEEQLSSVGASDL